MDKFVMLPREPERWLPIPGWPIYEASDEGRVRSIPRFTRAKAGSVMRRRGVTLKQRPDHDGYPTVSLHNVSLDLKKTRKVAHAGSPHLLGATSGWHGGLSQRRRQRQLAPKQPAVRHAER